MHLRHPLRKHLRRVLVVSACTAAVAGVSIWFVPESAEQVLWSHHAEHAVSAQPLPIQCRVDRASLAGRLLIVHATSLRYTSLPASSEAYRRDHGIGSAQDMGPFTHESLGMTTDYDRRFPLDADQDPVTWRPKPRLAYSLVRTSDPYRNGWDFELLVPYWILTAVTAAPMAFLTATSFLKSSRRTRRQDAGHCASCNYDLRASTTRCPECGHPIPKPQDERKADERMGRELQ